MGTLNASSYTAKYGDIIKFTVSDLMDKQMYYVYVCGQYIQEELYGTYNSDPLSRNVKKYTIPDDRSEELECTLYAWNSDDFAYELQDQIIITIDTSDAGYDPPTISSFTASPSLVVQGVSPITLTVEVSSPGSGEIDYYKFSDSWNTIEQINGPELSAEATFSAPSISGERQYTVYVYNTNGQMVEESISIDVCPYSTPSFLYFKAYRSDADGRATTSGLYITYEYQVDYSSVENNNKITTVNIVCDGVLINEINSSSGRYTTAQYYENSEDETTHNLYAVAYDAYDGSTVSPTVTILGSVRILNISKDGTGFAVGKLSESNNKFECAWDAQFYGNVTVVGTVDSNGDVSDERVKQNIQDVEIDIVDKLHPIQYQLVNENDGKNHYGFLAQEVIKVFEDENIDSSTVGLVGNASYNDIDIYTLKYTEFIPLLVIKCQTLQQELNDLKSEIKALKEST